METTGDEYYDRNITDYINANPDDKHYYVKALTAPITLLFKESGASATESVLSNLWLLILGRAQKTAPVAIYTVNGLVNLVKAIKSLGPLTSTDGYADTAAGRLYSDLPFFGNAIYDKWHNGPPFMPADEWANLNTFVARLTAADIFDAKIYCLLSTRAALEMERPLRAKGADPLGDVPVEVLLPAAVAWFHTCADQIAQWCVDGYCYDPRNGLPDPAHMGTLCEQENIRMIEDRLAAHAPDGKFEPVRTVTQGGFVVHRWRFWRSRLLTLSESRDRHGRRMKVGSIALKGHKAMGIGETKQCQNMQMLVALANRG